MDITGSSRFLNCVIMKKYRVDLHTHSKLSPDGSIEEVEYQKVLQTGKLDFVAITDHNTIEYAVLCQKKLGQQIIVGEEISTIQGHLIGLFLKKVIKPHQDVLTTTEQIHSQGGLVYVPHAYDVFRHGIGEQQLKRIVEATDIIEICNGRMLFEYFNKKANDFAIKHHMTEGFGSDSHFANSLGSGALILPNKPTAQPASFKNGDIEPTAASFLRFLAPDYNRLKKIFT
jgi:predicted metal-dependent phosphoesterase TrpH